MLMNAPFRFLQFASYVFDACLVEMLTTLMLGGTVCVPREEDRTNGNIAAVMEKMGVTMALLTPSFARVLEPASVPQLKTLILGGEAMAQSHVDTWADKVNLVNAYGPSECAVVATVNPKMFRTSNPANLGRGLGRCWIVDAQNADRLAPLGSVGELLVEGPTLSTGYLQNEEKTREAFIEDPRWTQDEKLSPAETCQTPRRMYKTGDLVRVCDDASGEMVYVGRKDSSQAKVNGQRLELDEICLHIVADKSIRHAVVVLPKTGPCANRLVAVISPREVSGGEAGSSATHELEVLVSREASILVGNVQERLQDKLPPYMLPATWIVLNRIPLLPSGKLNRTSVVRLVEGMTDETCDKITAAQAISQMANEEEIASPVRSLSVDETLKSIWSQVLNISSERIGPKVSFLHLGGDSITAMHVMAACRAQGISITVQDIIRSKSVHELALKAGIPKTLQQSALQQQHVDEDHHEFDPTPIQQLYFQLVGDGATSAGMPTQFNQSVLLRGAKNVSSDELRRGLHALVETHSMLRARFRRDGTGNWRQRITSDISGSYCFKTHAVGSKNRMEKRIRTSQMALDIQKGPLLVADYFNIANKEVCVFLTIHHLVVDAVSWGVILQDLEDFFATGSIKSPASVSFQSWSRKQLEQTQTNGSGLLPHHEPATVDLDYWGMAGVPNDQSTTVTENVELDIDETALLLGPECHEPLETEPLDILLAALLLSYRSASVGRQGAPTIYNEGHGRESWDDAMDLSRTVGWFTTLCPVQLPHESSSGKLSIVDPFDGDDGGF